MHPLLGPRFPALPRAAGREASRPQKVRGGIFSAGKRSTENAVLPVLSQFTFITILGGSMVRTVYAVCPTGSPTTAPSDGAPGHSSIADFGRPAAAGRQEERTSARASRGAQSICRGRCDRAVPGRRAPGGPSGATCQTTGRPAGIFWSNTRDGSARALEIIAWILLFSSVYHIRRAC